MAQLHFVECARRAIPEAGIEIGDQYYWYKKRVNGKGVPRTCSKTKPPRSAYVTSSPFLGALMDMEDACTAICGGLLSQQLDYVIAWLEARADEVEAMANNCSEKSQSVEQGMKNGAGNMSAEMLRSRDEHCRLLASALREAAGELVSVSEEPLSEDGEEELYVSVTAASVLGSILWLP